MKTIQEAILEEIQKINKNEDLPKDKSIINKISRDLQKIRGLVPKKDLNQAKLKKSFPSKKDGYLYMMEYVPPDKNKRVFFDRFPVILVLGFFGNKFVGVNLHILPLRERVLLMFFIIKNMRKTKEKYARIKISSLLSNKTILKYILETKDTFYATGIRSKIRPIEKEEIVESVFLPVEKFIGMPKLKVHSMMRKRLRANDFFN
jgi:hypothetical protein